MASGPSTSFAREPATVCLVLLLLAILGVSWLLVRGDGTPAAPEQAHVVQEPRAESDAVVDVPVAAGLREEAPDEAEVAGEGPLDDALLAGPIKWDGLSIRVVLAETGEPVPGIDVVVMNDSTLDGEGLLLYRIRRDAGGLFERCGRRTPTDEYGIARIPRPSGGEVSFVFVEQEDLFGALEIGSKGPDELELRLTPDPAVRVRVVDLLGQPVEGVEVVLRGSEEDPELPRRASGFLGEDRELARATSDAQGLATLRRWHARLYPKEYVRVGLVLIGAGPIEAFFDGQAPPGEPIDLVLPDCGRVVVELELPDGGPVGAGVLVKLAQPREAGRLGQSSFWYAEPAKALHAIASDGRAVFESVALGEGELEVSAIGPGFEPGEARTARPAVRGETVVVRFALGAATPLAVGRVVSADGRPIANTHFDVHVILQSAEGGGSSYDELATDGDGRFRCPLPTDMERPNWFDVALTLEEGEGSRRSASFELPGDVPPGETEVGTLVLADTPALLAGVVVDEQDRPVRGASVFCKERVVLGGGGTAWSWPPNARTRTRSDGTFVIQASSPDATLYVEATREGYLPLEEVEVATGRRDLRLVLQTTAPSGAIAGRLLVEGSSVRGIEIVLRASGAAGNTHREWLYSDEFQLSNVPVGTQVLEVRFWPERRELMRFEGIEVIAGQTTHDPRLDPLDLRDRLRIFRVRVVSADGDVLPAFGVARRLPDESEYGVPAWSPYGEATREVATTSPALDLRIEAIGKRTVELLSVDGDREVWLEPGIPVRVVLSGERPALPGNAVVLLSLHPRDRHVGVVAVHESQLDAAGGANLLVGEAGTYRLQIEVRMPSARGFDSSAGVRAGDGLDVEVHDTPETEEISRPVGLEAWHTALRELGIDPSSDG